MAIAGTAVLRAADALLRALGGDQIALVLPFGIDGDAGQLGRWRCEWIFRRRRDRRRQRLPAANRICWRRNFCRVREQPY